MRKAVQNLKYLQKKREDLGQKQQLNWPSPVYTYSKQSPISQQQHFQQQKTQASKLGQQILKKQNIYDGNSNDNNHRFFWAFFIMFPVIGGTIFWYGKCRKNKDQFQEHADNTTHDKGLQQSRQYSQALNISALYDEFRQNFEQFKLSILALSQDEREQQLFQKGIELAKNQSSSQSMLFSIMYFNEVLMLNPNNIKALFNKAMILRENKEYREAIDCFSQVSNLLKNQEILKQQNIQGDSLKEYELSLLLELGKTYIKSESSYKEALQCFGEMEHLSQENSKYQIQSKFYTAVILTKLHHIEEALELYNQIIDTDSKKFGNQDLTVLEAYFNKGVILQSQKNHQEAIKIFEQSLSIDKKQMSTYIHLGISKASLGLHDEAIKLYQKALILDPNYAVTYYNMGNTYYQQKKFEQAAQAYGNAIEQQPQIAFYYINKGVSLQALDKLDESLDCFNSAIEINPSYIEAHINKGIILSDQGKKNEALKSFDRAIQIDPSYAPGYLNKGNLLEKSFKNQKAALDCYNKAIKAQPAYTEAYYKKAVVLLELGNIKHSMVCLEEALSIDPNHERASIMYNSMLDQLKKVQQ